MKKNANVQLKQRAQTNLFQKETRGDIGLPFGGDDNARIRVVEAIFSQSHEGGIFLHEQDEFGVAFNVCDAINVRWNGSAAETHAAAINQVTARTEGHATDDDALLGRNN
jgi:hypothetical protein